MSLVRFRLWALFLNQNVSVQRTNIFNTEKNKKNEKISRKGQVRNMYSLEEIKQADPEIAECICQEVQRQNSHIELIASENWVSKAVMAAMGSPLTNKYAEG